MNEQQQKKGSLRWLRIILTVLGVIVLIPIVLLGFLIFWAYHGPHAPTVGDAFNASGQYYNAIQHHDYTTASNYLRGNATITVHGRPMVMNSVDTLSTTSKALDTRDGVITSYTTTDGNFEQGKDIVDMVMKVTRNDQPYDVHIKIELEGNDWKILSADGI